MLGEERPLLYVLEYYLRHFQSHSLATGMSDQEIGQGRLIIA